MTRPSQPPFFDDAEPNPEFQARLRRAFVEGTGAFANAGATPTRDALELLRTSAQAEVARAAFAARLREQFVAGSLEAAPGAELVPQATARSRTASHTASRDAAAAPVRRQAPVHTLQPARLPLWRKVAPFLVAAAALFYAGVTWWTSRTPAWTVFNQHATVALVDGTPLASPDLRPGDQPCELCTTDRNLRFGYADLFRVELARDSQIQLRSPRVEVDGRVHASIAVDRGEVVCAARRDARLEVLVIETPAAAVRVSGGTVSVLVMPSGAVCICVGEGEVEVVSTVAAGARVVVRDGERAHALPDGTLSVSADGTDERRLANLVQVRDDLEHERFEASDYGRGWNVLDVY
jgi:hypothetical protein